MGTVNCTASNQEDLRFGGSLRRARLLSKGFEEEEGEAWLADAERIRGHRGSRTGSHRNRDERRREAQGSPGMRIAWRTIEDWRSKDAKKQDMEVYAVGMVPRPPGHGSALFAKGLARKFCQLCGPCRSLLVVA